MRWSFTKNIMPARWLEPVKCGLPTSTEWGDQVVDMIKQFVVGISRCLVHCDLNYAGREKGYLDVLAYKVQ